MGLMKGDTRSLGNGSSDARCYPSPLWCLLFAPNHLGIGFAASGYKSCLQRDRHLMQEPHELPTHDYWYLNNCPYVAPDYLDNLGIGHRQ